MERKTYTTPEVEIAEGLLEHVLLSGSNRIDGDLTEIDFNPGTMIPGSGDDAASRITERWGLE